MYAWEGKREAAVNDGRYFRHLALPPRKHSPGGLFLRHWHAHHSEARIVWVQWPLDSGI